MDWGDAMTLTLSRHEFKTLPRKRIMKLLRKGTSIKVTR